MKHPIYVITIIACLISISSGTYLLVSKISIVAVEDDKFKLQIKTRHCKNNIPQFADVVKIYDGVMDGITSDQMERDMHDEEMLKFAFSSVVYTEEWNSDGVIDQCEHIADAESVELTVAERGEQNSTTVMLVSLDQQDIYSIGIRLASGEIHLIEQVYQKVNEPSISMIKSNDKNNYSLRYTVSATVGQLTQYAIGKGWVEDEDLRRVI